MKIKIDTPEQGIKPGTPVAILESKTAEKVGQIVADFGSDGEWVFVVKDLRQMEKPIYHTRITSFNTAKAVAEYYFQKQ